MTQKVPPVLSEADGADRARGPQAASLCRGEVERPTPNALAQDAPFALSGAAKPELRNALPFGVSRECGSICDARLQMHGLVKAIAFCRGRAFGVGRRPTTRGELVCR